MTVSTSEFAFALIAVFEGCKLKAYKDTGGIITIGLGHTGPDVTEGMVITQEQALALFAKDAAPLLALVPMEPKTRSAALVSFGYNCGMKAMKKAMVDIREIDDPRHCTDRKGNVLAGLVSRRRLESTLCKI
ncbi:hypothetical protein EHM92_00050 [bacterium]|nr:MAG: hypothetical protein EHM92_00050 [bacterium]